MNAAKEFAKELFAEEDRNQFADVIENLVRETPCTPLAVERVKKFLEKAGPAVSETFYKITVDVMIEAVKKSIWGC